MQAVVTKKPFHINLGGVVSFDLLSKVLRQGYGWVVSLLVMDGPHSWLHDPLMIVCLSPRASGL